VVSAIEPAANLFATAAYGGEGWSPRSATLREEIGSIWSPCGVDSEWAPLRAVLLHRPGDELAQVVDPDEAQMIASLDVARARQQHDHLVSAFREAGVAVHYVEPGGPALSSSNGPASRPSNPRALPNLMFVADLMLMTPEGAILGRPASTVRAGEERLVARRLADLGIPILLTVRNGGTFEGADAAWLGPEMVLLASGLRTNPEGAAQVMHLLRETGVEVVQVGLPYGVMHLMGQLRFADRDLAVAWPGRVPHAAVEALRSRGFRVLFLPHEEEARHGMALNFVTLGPRRILMPAGNDVTQSFYEEAGIDCTTVEVSELTRAAGGIGCLTGILHRALID
jgi:N-dimethylarginine dimethylaminohydrolase